jgi:Zn-dependent protease
MSLDLHDALLRLALVYLPLVGSLALHEYAHAQTATALGDDTPRVQGRLTLNPLAHLDPFGSVLLPVALVLMGQAPFGWARPVQVSAHRFRKSIRMHTGLMLTAAAGPVTNLVLAALAGVGYAGAGSSLAVATWRELMGLNVMLFLFNLLPVPPLDGSRVLAGLLPTTGRDLLRRAERLAPMFLALLFFSDAVPFVLTGPARAIERGCLNLGRFFFP